MSRTDAEKRFLCLDALRGVAAAIVFIRHGPGWFGGEPFHGSMLAVDLFFIMSGFIVAHAYEARLRAGLGAGAFIRLRLIRFYPLYLLGLAIGAGAVMIGLLLGMGTAYSGHVWTWRGLALELGFGVAMLPTPHMVSHQEWLFPLNSVAWSLFLEVLINIVYGLTWRHWTIRNLGVTLALSGAALAFVIMHFGGADIGFSWSNIIGGVPRVIFGFAAGVMLFRLWEAGWFRFSTPWWLALGAAVLVMAARAEGEWRIALDIASVLVLLPIVVALGITARTPRALAASFAALGAISYALYALHRPLLVASNRVAAMAGISLEQNAPWIGLVLLGILALLCLALERWFDQPMRRWLTARLAPRRLTMPPQPAEGAAR